MVRDEARKQGREIFFISALTGEGLEPLVERMWQLQANMESHAPANEFAAGRFSPEEPENMEDGGDEAFDIEVVYCK